MFRKSNTRAVWIASMGLLIIACLRSASGDDLVSVQQTPQPAVAQSSNVGGTSVDHDGSNGNCNHLRCRLARPWVLHEHSEDCNCLTCRCRRSCFSRNAEVFDHDKQLFHWYIRGNGPAIHTRPAGIYWW